MQIRRPKRRRWQEVPFLSFLLLSAPVILIFWISTRRHHLDKSMDGGDMDHHFIPLVEQPRIIYEVVVNKEQQDADTAKIIRYKALEENHEDGMVQPLTIQRWALLMTHDNKTYAQQVAMNLTHILQVRAVRFLLYVSFGLARIPTT
jgi:hypothetical protein